MSGTQPQQSQPLVSVVTPTWGRHEELLERCIPSVAAQTYGNVEHIVVSDGPDDALYQRIRDHVAMKAYNHPEMLRYLELAEHDDRARWGHFARLAGIAAAKGEIIAYLDDDNSYRPEHLSLLVQALLDNPAAGFAYPRTQMHVHGNVYEIGADPPAYGQVDTSGIVHRRELLDRANWLPSLPSIDWDLVNRWMVSGAKWAYVPVVTVDYFKE
jgi:glycosyltransferase involved in cell wall biosynthesis